MSFDALKFIEITGYIGTVITSCCFLPPVIKTIRERTTASQSLWMWILEIVGCTIWISSFIVQAIDKPDEQAKWLPTIITNCVLWVSSIPMLVIKINNMIQAKKRNISELEYDNILHWQKRQVKN
ncbi:MAG: hypothetical protein LBC44_02210 [Mycoplasmataceae bacterium]|nr:hypothetical protein [Mycoplasmataceae bacterium]